MKRLVSTLDKDYWTFATTLANRSGIRNVPEASSELIRSTIYYRGRVRAVHPVVPGSIPVTAGTN